MSWWRWNAKPKPETFSEFNPMHYIKSPEDLRRFTEALLDEEMLAEEKANPSCMWDWISPARIKRPYVS